MKKLRPWHIRQQLSKLRQQREALETTLMVQRREMIKSCLIARQKLADGKMRKSPAYYLSQKVNGKTKLTYVKKNHLKTIQRATDSWREFSSTLARWVKLTSKMERLFRKLGKAQQTNLKKK